MKQLIVILMAYVSAFSSDCFGDMNLKSMQVLYSQWMCLSKAEEKWIIDSGPKRSSLIDRISPDQATARALLKVKDTYKDLVQPATEVLYFNGMVGKQKAEFYQVKVFFYAGKESSGTPLCESILIRRDEQIHFQRR